MTEPDTLRRSSHSSISETQVSSSMWFASILFSLLPVLHPFSLPQGQNPPGTMDVPKDEVDLNDVVTDAEVNAELEREAALFAPLLSRYENAVAGYRFEIRELRNARVKRSEFPPSPVLEYFPLFSALADGSNGAASFWLIQHATEFVHDDTQLVDYLRDYYGTLASKHASGDYIEDALELIMKSRKLLGESFVFEFLHGIQDNSRRRKTASMALQLEASALVSRRKGEDPERRARAEEIWYILIDGYPGTTAAKFAGTPLLRVLLKEMLTDQVAWATHAEELRAQGAGPEQWGLPPFERHGRLIQTIAGAGHPIAQAWSNRFFPGMEQAARDGLLATLSFETNWMGRGIDVGREDWVDLRYRLLNLMFAAYPNEELTFEAIGVLGKYVAGLDIPRSAQVLSRLVEWSENERIIAEAKLVLATVLTRSTHKTDLERATVLYAEVKATAPLDRQKEMARELGLRFSWTMPGAVHTTLNMTDSDEQPLTTLSYRGKIILLFFWSLDVPGCKEEIEFVKGMHEHYSEAPFRVLGINGEMFDLRGFRRATKKLGIEWRNVLLQERDNWVANTMGVSIYPQSVVIDDLGVIRGRGLNHEETYALVDQLVTEMASRDVNLVSATTGKVRGLVRYGGSEPALAPLSIPDAQISSCTADGRELDLTDRKRLVSDSGGLANVVLSVQVPERIAKGMGKKFRVERSHCRYEPHVIVVPQGARLEVSNGDQTPLGTGARSLHNSSFNVILLPGGAHETELIAVDRFQLSSDTDPWMSSWVVVSDTPFTALSDAAGEFSIPGLPPGKYVADWWHETLGSGQSVEFEITPAGTALIELVVGAQER